MCYIFFIHFSVNEHLGCFHILAIVNSGAVSIVMHLLCGFMIFSVYLPRSGTARSYGNSIFNFLRTFHAVSIVAPSLILLLHFILLQKLTLSYQFFLLLLLKKIQFFKKKLFILCRGIAINNIVVVSGVQ